MPACMPEKTSPRPRSSVGAEAEPLAVDLVLLRRRPRRARNACRASRRARSTPPAAEMGDRIVEVVQDADVVAEVGAKRARRRRAASTSYTSTRGRSSKKRAAHDRLDDVLDPRVDRRHPLGEPAERDRVDALEAADLEHVLVARGRSARGTARCAGRGSAAARSRLPRHATPPNGRPARSTVKRAPRAAARSAARGRRPRAARRSRASDLALVVPLAQRGRRRPPERPGRARLEPDPHEVVEPDEADAASVLDHGQDGDLRRPILHQPQRLVGHRVRADDDGLARHDLLGAQARRAPRRSQRCSVRRTSPSVTIPSRRPSSSTMLTAPRPPSRDRADDVEQGRLAGRRRAARRRRA